MCNWSKISYDTSINRNINFDEKRLENKVFENITFIKCSFEKSYLANCTFIDCKFINCNFVRNDLTESDFSRCEYYFIPLKDNKLKNTKISYPGIIPSIKDLGLEVVD